MEIYQMAGVPAPWNIFPMASNVPPDKKIESEARAKQLYERLMALPRHDEIASNNKWTKAAGVSTSFFTNLQGNEKPASEPSIGNLRRILRAAGTTVPEFFLNEAEGRVVRVPSRPALESVLAKALEELPARDAKKPAVLASIVLRALGLPEHLPAIAEDEGYSSQDGSSEDTRVHRARRQG